MHPPPPLSPPASPLAGACSDAVCVSTKLLLLLPLARFPSNSKVLHSAQTFRKKHTESLELRPTSLNTHTASPWLKGRKTAALNTGFFCDSHSRTTHTAARAGWPHGRRRMEGFKQAPGSPPQQLDQKLNLVQDSGVFPKNTQHPSTPKTHQWPAYSSQTGALRHFSSAPDLRGAGRSEEGLSKGNTIHRRTGRSLGLCPMACDARPASDTVTHLHILLTNAHLH